MVFEELHNRYGAHVAKRVQQELTPSELAQISLEQLPVWLETRAETAHKEYQTRLGDPFADQPNGNQLIDTLYRRWREAEDLAYIIAVAEGVSVQARVGASGK